MSLLSLEKFLNRGNRVSSAGGSLDTEVAQREELPFRAEIFGIEQLQVHAKVIAGWHKLAAVPQRDRLITRLNENEDVLVSAYESVSAQAARGHAISPGGEWLIDNYYLIEEQIRTARRHLPRRYSRQLPQLRNGPAANLPRVYHIALELIAHLDGRIDIESLTRFVAAYQHITPLRIGELWAVPIMLRLALIENLRRIASRIALGLEDRKIAETWAQRLIQMAEHAPATLILGVADMARSNPILSNAFVAEFSRHLQGKSPSLGISLSWIEQRLSEHGQSIEGRVQLEAQQQAANQVSMGNSIASLRVLSAIDWREFVESQSVLELALLRDPAGIYGQMDFATRDRYRHVVENVAKRSGATEEEAAGHAIRFATRSAAENGAAHRTAHVGYYLVARGLPQLEAAVHARIPLYQRFRRRIVRMPLMFYLGLIALLTGGMTFGLTVYATGWRIPATSAAIASWVGLMILLLFATSQLAIALVNWAVQNFMSPRMLSRMNFSHGIAPESATMVVVPTMLASLENAERLLEGLEVRYLSNRDDHLWFALLTDYKDSDSESLPNDAVLLKAVLDGVEDLNRRYGRPENQPFFLFHRPRRWNASEKKWMGWERKRGKLTEFNAVLRGDPGERFQTIVGDKSILRSIRYVITLDTDTELPRDVARELAATMAHPLVRPELDAKTGLVREGYAILQPRVSISLPSANRSWFVKCFAGDPGIDPYTRVVSDVYQDMFEEGSFIGKGIYDVDAFETILQKRFPENRILSHDLLEGSYARSGLVSDIQLYEDHPSHYAADMRRRHRWIRGDWQIARWLLPWVPEVHRRVWNPLSRLSRWKIFDNLRRSLVAPALLLLLAGGWTLSASPGFWTAVVLGICLIPALLPLVEIFRKPRECTFRVHFNTVGLALARHLAQIGLGLIFLPYEALYGLDGILRTLFRVIVSRRRLLEWETAGDAQERARNTIGGFFAAMLSAPLLALGITVLLLMAGSRPNLVACPFLAFWLGSPAIAWLISQPLSREKSHLTAEQHRLMRVVARQTWRFFETFVDAEDHFLPPDNFQEYPIAVVAHRTSPTNIGLGLLSTLTAYDFGYISTGELIDRTGKTLLTMETLERFRGHFYNWYDTRSLAPLPPLYVSSVDSGNLAAFLMTFRQGLLELADQPVLCPRAFEGLGDLVLMLDAMIQRNDSTSSADQKICKNIAGDLQAVLRELEQVPHSLAGSVLLLERIQARATAIEQALGGAVDEELRLASGALTRQCRGLRDDLLFLAPWITLPPASENQWTRERPEVIVQLNELREKFRRLDHMPTIRAVAGFQHTFLPQIDAVLEGGQPEDKAAGADFQWLAGLRKAIGDAAARATQRCVTLDSLATQCDVLAQMDFQFLYDKSRKQLAIGYNVSERRRDVSYYDLLASESRLGSFVTIAQGQLPQESWFALGRNLTTSGGRSTLLSWSGSMFEYLMPLLVMPTYDNTLLDHTYRTVVARQIRYGDERGVPWGISESGYNMTDAQLNYQYRAFGVPGLGFKRGLTDDLVIAPYATVMGVMVDPESACRNMQRLAESGMMGRYGFYEAADYTPVRVPQGQNRAVVRSFMSHHAGMSFLALAYQMLGRPMQRRFLADPYFKATELLLHERVPRATPVYPHAAQIQASENRNGSAASLMRVLNTPHTSTPEIHLLSNGRYHVMISNSGGGYSRWKEIAVTRWREDPTRDCWGSFCYIRDVERQAFWSATFQPTLKTSEIYEAIFQQARAEFRRRDGDIDSHTEISVSPEDDVEVRRITVTNRSRKARTVDVTSYAEVVIAASAADAAHPAFSNLFVQTRIIPNRRAILCTRRPRSLPERPPWMFHLMSVEGNAQGKTSYETDRAQFIGRGRSIESPAAMEEPNLSDSQGAVLDPIVAIRQTVVLEPGESAKVVIVTGIAETQEAATGLIEKYHDPRLAERVFEMAWTHSQVTLRQLNAEESDALLFARLAGYIVHPNRQFRADPAILAKNRRGQSGLWSYSISGDLPIVLLRVGDPGKIELVRQMVQAHAYWRIKGLAVDLIVWNEDHSGYRQALQDQIIGLINAGPEAHSIDRPGGIFVRRADQMSEEDRVLMQSVARVILTDSEGTFAEQVEKHARPGPTMQRLVPSRRFHPQAAAAPLPRRELVLFNGIGGFTPDGKEYVIHTDEHSVTPAPWVNVLANPRLGTVVSESGSAYTWYQNAHECRLTPWSCDPVSDGSGEALYIRDDDTGEFWSPTPLPARGTTPYITRHGMGYSAFEHVEYGVYSELTFYVATDAPVKFAVLKISNQSERARRLSIAGYWEWVLGELRAKSLMHVVTEVDPRTGALIARNPYNTEFADMVAFVDVNDPARSITGDRTEFIGRNGTLANPAALERRRLSGKTGAGLDPCAAILLPVELADGQQREIVFIFGAGQNIEEARQLIGRFRSSHAARKAFENTTNYWNQTLGAVQVETPDPSVNILANGWLVYQTLACRMWARSGFYQSGGAYGFRDQLQDAMALVHAEPALLREHLLRCAAHQFREGDVQHWWHPPLGRGVRTHFSDDFLWLPLAAARYVTALGDTGVLDERINYLEGRPVKPEEEAYYDLPARSDKSASLYDHCVQAIENGLKFGVHGLPLMGCGDWNDGMNLVGEHGQGESVWLAFFLFHVLQQFAPIAERRGDTAFAARCQTQAAQLLENIELHAWDGQWYRRAYFDNGEPLGSATNPECQIDSLPQSWSILANAGDPARRKQAMAAVNERLVNRESGIIELFTPPFDKSPLNPGYIKGYVPGVRENGGQYTHAAVWTTMAFAAMGDVQRTWELFTMINPLNRGGTSQAIATYKVEPYVVAADVYGVPPHTGRGGWTWYTGSAGWMYRLVIETLLGLTREPERLRITPALPAAWNGFKLRYRYRETTYSITIARSTDGTAATTLDGIVQADHSIALVNDRIHHQATIFLPGPR